MRKMIQLLWNKPRLIFSFYLCLRLTSPNYAFMRHRLYSKRKVKEYMLIINSVMFVLLKLTFYFGTRFSLGYLIGSALPPIPSYLAHSDISVSQSSFLSCSTGGLKMLFWLFSVSSPCLKDDVDGRRDSKRIHLDILK